VARQVAICKHFKAHRGSVIECERRGVLRPAECKWVFGAAKCDHFEVVIVPGEYLDKIMECVKKSDIICFRCKHLDTSKPISPGDLYCKRKKAKVLAHIRSCPLFEPLEELERSSLEELNDVVEGAKREEKKGHRRLLDWL